MPKTILIIESDLFILDLYRLLFMKKGFDVLTATDGQSGLEMARKNRVDAVLLELMLPKVSGLEVLRNLRLKDSPTANTPVFILSNLGQEEVVKEVFSLGVQGYMVKADCLPQQVVDKVTHYLERGKSQK